MKILWGCIYMIWMWNERFHHNAGSLALLTFSINLSIRCGQFRFFSGSQVSSLWEKPFQWIRNSRDPFFLKWTSITLSTYTKDQSNHRYSNGGYLFMEIKENLFCFKFGENSHPGWELHPQHTTICATWQCPSGQQQDFRQKEESSKIGNVKIFLQSFDLVYHTYLICEWCFSTITDFHNYNFSCILCYNRWLNCSGGMTDLLTWNWCIIQQIIDLAGILSVRNVSINVFLQNLSQFLNNNQQEKHFVQ